MAYPINGVKYLWDMFDIDQLPLHKGNRSSGTILAKGVLVKSPRHQSIESPGINRRFVFLCKSLDVQLFEFNVCF